MRNSYPYTRNAATGLTTAKQFQFCDLAIGQTFDFIGPDHMYNSFYKRCTKSSARKYVDEDGTQHRVGSITADVFHVDGAEA